MANFFKKDAHFVGVIIGLLVPLIAYGLLNLLNLLIIELFNLDMFMRDHVMRLIAIFMNALPLRYYFVTAKLEQTGRGILFVFLIYTIVYFSMY
ncbi:MAG: hypothetical protein K9G58_13590 [Bacteroidales bacterium]|nr:hypothetical protein [Bacteroidales bacterium]MCF8388875.1 hypothetical protein [Bacteroidales bacterium]MCF8399202.1 hypothetical protein [Bacteroidales bacterium]